MAVGVDQFLYFGVDALDIFIVLLFLFELETLLREVDCRFQLAENFQERIVQRVEFVRELALELREGGGEGFVRRGMDDVSYRFRL